MNESPPGPWAALARRKLVQWAIGYIAGAWAVLQGLSLLSGTYGWAPSVMRVGVGVAVIGFGVAMVLAWYHGERGQQRVTRGEFALLALLVALGAGALWYSERAGRGPEPGTTVAKRDGAPESSVPTKSIAVLPFLALSKGEEDGYFADGVTEEILTALSQLPDLLVTARTSAFHFKGKDVPIPEIARQLGVAHVLEGSVRRQGDKVRITAQLIRAQDGFHLWSENYDRDAKDTIAVQDDIAQRVATALDVLLDETRRAAMRRVAIGDVEAFVAYQKGMDLYLRAHLQRDSPEFLSLLRESQAAFDRALARAPGLFNAQLLRGDLYNHQLMEPVLYDEPPLPPAEARAALVEVREGNARSQAAARNEDERASASVTRIYFSDDWTGFAAASTRLFRAQGCVETVFNDAPLAFGLADAAKGFYHRQIACDPLELEYYWSLASALLWLGDYAGVASAAEQQASHAEHDFRLDWIQMLAFAASGKVEEAEALTASSAPRGRISPAGYAVLLAAMRGDADLARKRWDALAPSEKGQRLGLMASAWRGEREAANAVAAKIDGEMLGAVALAEVTRHCYCGAPFDIDRTPNFKARMAESGFAWPPKKPVPTPLKDW